VKLCDPTHWLDPMTQRQLAEKCDEPGCLNILQSYSWLPLLLLNQLHGQLLQHMSRPADRWLLRPKSVAFQPPREPEKDRPAVPVESAKTKWLFGAWDATRDHSPGDQIIQGVVPGWSTRSLLTDTAVQSLHINWGPTVTFTLHTKSQTKPQTSVSCLVLFLTASSSSLNPHDNIIIVLVITKHSCSNFRLRTNDFVTSTTVFCQTPVCPVWQFHV